MKQGESKKGFNMILAIWPKYEPLTGIWEMQELAVNKESMPKWRKRRVPMPQGGVSIDRYPDASAALAECDAANIRYAAELEAVPLEDDLRRSLQLKTIKALQAKKRLQHEEAQMLEEAKRRKAAVSASKAEDLILTAKAEPYRQALAQALNGFPYVNYVRVGELKSRIAMRKTDDGTWDILTNGGLTKRGAIIIERSKIALGFDLNPRKHWGEVKAKIRKMLLPRANQKLQLASVQRLLDEALARGERVLVCGNVVYWYETDGVVEWQVKTTARNQQEKKTTLWTEGTILSKNHGRLVILPYIKENGEKVKGHTRNAPKDGVAKPRHSTQYVDIPFTVVKSDLMIGLYGELPYE